MFIVTRDPSTYSPVAVHGQPEMGIRRFFPALGREVNSVFCIPLDWRVCV